MHGALPWMDEEPAESLWVRISGQTNTGDIVVDVCCRPPDHEEVVKAFLRQLEEASCLQADEDMGDFKHPSICWKGRCGQRGGWKTV